MRWTSENQELAIFLTPEPGPNTSTPGIGPKLHHPNCVSATNRGSPQAYPTLSNQDTTPTAMPWAGMYRPNCYALVHTNIHGKLPAKSFGLLQQGESSASCAAAVESRGTGRKIKGRVVVVRVLGGEEGPSGRRRRSFLTLEEAGLVEMSGLSSHEKFLCRLTISSLNLLQVISEQEGCPIEELNAGRICDWFVKDRIKREQNIESAILQWDESEFQL